MGILYLLFNSHKKFNINTTITTQPIESTCILLGNQTMSAIQDQIDKIEAEMARTQKNKA